MKTVKSHQVYLVSGLVLIRRSLVCYSEQSRWSRPTTTYLEHTQKRTHTQSQPHTSTHTHIHIMILVYSTHNTFWDIKNILGFNSGSSIIHPEAVLKCTSCWASDQLPLRWWLIFTVQMYNGESEPGFPFLHCHFYTAKYACRMHAFFPVWSARLHWPR